MVRLVGDQYKSNTNQNVLHEPLTISFPVSLPILYCTHLITSDQQEVKEAYQYDPILNCSGETMDDDKGCHDQTNPIHREGYRGIETDPRFMNTAESAIQKLKARGVKLQYLNITQLSDQRIDAHPSIHKKMPNPLTEEQLKDPKSYSDCVHWCLPGVPDVWNQILYTYIINS